jgi:hypothetical protein
MQVKHGVYNYSDRSDWQNFRQRLMKTKKKVTLFHGNRSCVVTQVWGYVGEIILSMLVLVGTVKMADRVVREMYLVVNTVQRAKASASLGSA